MLIVDMLDGVPESHKILADLLEESGERGLAQWARARKGKLSQRLSFALAVLPYRRSLEIGCHFLATWMEAHEDIIRPFFEELKFVWNWAQLPPKFDTDTDAGFEILKERKRWRDMPESGVIEPDWPYGKLVFRELFYEIENAVLEEEVAGTLFHRFFDRETPDRSARLILQNCIDEFDLAIGWAAQTVAAERNSDLGAQRNGAAETKNHLRKLLRLITQHPRKTSIYGVTDNPWWEITEQIKPNFYPKISVMQEQVEYVKTIITKMIESKSQKT